MAEAAELPKTEVVSIDSLIKKDAAKWKVSPEKLYKTIKCESNFVVDARGDNGLARGLSQIRSDYHPDISEDEADDPAYAINYMAEEFSKDHASAWSCYRHLYGSSSPLN